MAIVKKKQLKAMSKQELDAKLVEVEVEQKKSTRSSRQKHRKEKRTTQTKKQNFKLRHNKEVEKKQKERL